MVRMGGEVAGGEGDHEGARAVGQVGAGAGQTQALQVAGDLV